ncbi:MAG: hypothetical protein ABFD46_03190 [Armatimonadota bacterium]
MLESSKNGKICPLLAAFGGSRDQVSTGSNWASKCKGVDCAWWDAAHNNCAVTVISKELGEVPSMAVTPAVPA